MIHQLKIESEYFRKIVEGVKTFEVRKNDRDFHKGDYLGLNEITPHPCNAEGERKETGNFVLVRVLDIFSDNRFVKDGYVIMSIGHALSKKLIGTMRRGTQKEMRQSRYFLKTMTDIIRLKNVKGAGNGRKY